LRDERTTVPSRLAQKEYVPKVALSMQARQIFGPEMDEKYLSTSDLGLTLAQDPWWTKGESLTKVRRSSEYQEIFAPC
jgi:hypothetical protein